MNTGTTDKQTEVWHKLHTEEKMSQREIAKIYGVHRETVRRNFKKRGLPSFNYHNMIKHDEKKFFEISTEEDAYWLGFIYADGYVSDNNNFELSLKLSDFNHLKKFKDYLNLSTKIIKDDFRCRIVYKNKILVDNLKRLGVKPRKSLSLSFPEKVPVSLLRHFLRGYFDGDGSISIYKKKRKTMTSKIVNFSLLGTREFLDGARDYFPIDFGKYVKNHGSEKTLVLSTAHKKARKIIVWLYSDSNVYLDRKYKKSKQIAVLERNF